MTERNEINTIISEEMKNISNGLLALGQAYYDKHAYDYEPEFEMIIASIKASEEKIANMCVKPEAVEADSYIPEYDDSVPETVEAKDSVSAFAEPISMEKPVVEIIEEIPITESPVMPVTEPVYEAPVMPAEENLVERCPKCGAVYEEDASFCNTCGAPKNAPAEEDLVMCPSCKAMIRPGTNFCTSCGAVMPSAMPVAEPVYEAPAMPAAEPAMEASANVPIAPAPLYEAPAAAVVSAEENIFAPVETMEVYEAVQAPAMNVCPSCGAPVLLEGPFCTSCGGRLD